MPIDASLFAHILNDPFLEGTYKLGSNFFATTSEYLRQYLALLTSAKEAFPPEYSTLLKDMEYLVKIEKSLVAMSKTADPDVKGLADSIAKDVMAMAAKDAVLFRGGWQNLDGGHAEVYQFRAVNDEIEFTVVNSGSGLNYHAKKSSHEKELYNPLKIWRFPRPVTAQDKAELAHFIARLLKAQLPDLAENKKRAVTAKILYEEILPSISYLNGKEVDANIGFPKHGYTGGQLSGTCTQRSIHQLLKIKSSSSETYQRFIYKFKQHALFDYANACFAGQQPLNAAVADQIHLAIENNLKILNTPALFQAAEIEEQAKKLEELQKKLRAVSFKPPVKMPLQELNKPIVLKGNELQALPFNLSLNNQPLIQIPPPLISLGNGTNLLTKMEQAIKNINLISDLSTKYYYLEQLLLELPLKIDHGFYGELKNHEHYETFKKHLIAIQNELLDLQKNLFKKEQDPTNNLMILSILSLQIDVTTVISKSSKDPSFAPFSSAIMQAIIGNQEHNPFTATNHPVFDSRVKELQAKFKAQTTPYAKDYYNFLNKLLDREKQLNTDLKNLYQEHFGSNTTQLHEEVRKNNLESLFILAQHFNPISPLKLDPKFNPVIKKLEDHLATENIIKTGISHFFSGIYSIPNKIKLEIRDNRLFLDTDLSPVYMPWQFLTNSLPTSKYDLKKSPAFDALATETSCLSHYFNPIIRRSANNIQLKPGNAEEPRVPNQQITQADIKARDFFHLRGEPSLQIALTLDYFIRHIAMLSDESNQRYVEANLFQPGLLLEAMKEETFLPQFNLLLKTGHSFHSQNGQYTHNSLLFVRLDYLVNRYLLLNANAAGMTRLEAQQLELEKQLTLPNDPQVTYVIQQYLFLNILTQLNKITIPEPLIRPPGTFSPSPGRRENEGDLFNRAYKAYCYLNSHSNPSILEDKAHRFAMDSAKAQFKLLIRKQPASSIESAVKAVLLPYEQKAKQTFELSGSFPIYQLLNQKQPTSYQFNALTGQLFEQKLVSSGMPLALQNHPLIKHLGLSHIQTCFMNADESYIVLSDKKAEFRLHHKYNNLTVHKDWFFQGIKRSFELQALTPKHLAKKAHQDISSVKGVLPKILTDGSMDYWQSTSNPNEGLLVQNNIPVYAVKHGLICILDSKRNATNRILLSSYPLTLRLFEDHEFLLMNSSDNGTVLQMPRYHLNFKWENSSLVNQDTGEQVVERDGATIHPDIAGLLLKNNSQLRFLVPVARFYGTKEGAKISDFYPVVHDISGTIADAVLKAEPLEHKPLWHYKNSEKYVSFPFKDGKLTPNTVADALYLTYIYLATNQTEKAWKTLEECQTQFGGLTGAPEELQFISWICEDLPHVLPGSTDTFRRETPPYVACQLKAMSLLCQHLSWGNTFNLKPSIDNNSTANSRYASIQKNKLRHFLNHLPETLYNFYDRLQKMRRHLEHTYTLSTLECKRLLTYYHQQQPKDYAPKGSLGAEWMRLSQEELLKEQNALLARGFANQTLSKSEKSRLDLIQNQLKKLKPVLARSTALELVPIDLTLPIDTEMISTHLKPEAKASLEQWHHKLPGKSIDEPNLTQATNALSSAISEDDFIINFPAYFQLALSGKNKAAAKKLLDYCTKTLIAKRHVPLDKQSSNIPFLCNILYRLFHCPHVPSDDKYFSVWVTRLSGLQVIPPLTVYQAKDLYKDLLASPENLVANPEGPHQKPLQITPRSVNSLLIQTGIAAYLTHSTPQSKQLLDRFIAEYNDLQVQSDKKLAVSAAALNGTIDNSFVIEGQAGKILFDLEQQKMSIAERLIKNQQLTQSILQANKATQIFLKRQIELSWTKALKEANQEILQSELLKKEQIQRVWDVAIAILATSPAQLKERGQQPLPVLNLTIQNSVALAQTRTWKIERQAKARATLTKADLLSLYSRADLAYSIEKTGLSVENAQRLHDSIHTALIQGIQSQALDNISDHLTKASEGHVHRAAQALDILTLKEIPGLEDPSIILMQHEEGILLRKRQASALKSLLTQPHNRQGFKETIEKIIPGGGKSKVIIPILVEKKAQGNNVVIVEVPRALLSTNYVDLNRTSQRLFGKRAYLFEFSRDSDCTPERLEAIYKLLIEVMTTRSYLVCAGESIQSLELKYVELLLANNKKDETWKKQVYWCDKINSLLLHNGDCIIDEVHQGLSDKKKLNYPSGTPKPLDSLIIKNATALFNFIESDFIKSAPLFDPAYAWGPFVDDLSTKLINEASSPLNTFATQAIALYGEGIKQELIAYLKGTSTTEIEAVKLASANDKASLAFFRGEMVKLTQTLVQKKDKDYGGSHKPGLSAVEKTVAIPYAGSNVPNERTRFANDLEAINKAIQKMLLEGLTEEALIARILEWQASARREVFQKKANIEANPPSDLLDKNTSPLDKTPTGQGFNLLTQLQLSNIDTTDKEQMKSLHQKFQFNRPLIFDFLREFTLKMIKQEAAIIPSDNFNHVDQYRSVQGISGTPPLNTTTYHQRLHYDRTDSLGSDGYVLEVIRNKKPPISGIEYENPAQYIEAILSQSKSRERTRAIIDIKGTFTGVTNFAVAKEIAAYITKNPTKFGNPLKHVLYFNEDQVVCAIDINKPDTPIILGTSKTDELNRRLNSTPQERFTFYDQIHTLGTDLTQWEKAHAIVSIDDKNSLMDYIQGTMREREIALEQTNEFIVPSKLKALSIEDWHQKFETNEKRVIVKDAPSAARGQMKAYIRRRLLNLVYDVPSEEAEKKAQLMDHFRPFLEENPSADLFALYGGINKKQKIGDILGKYQALLLTNWNDCLKKANLPPDTNEIQKMTGALKQIIDKALPYCAAEYESSSHDSCTTEVEVQNVVQKEVEVETTAINETYSSQHEEAPQKNWNPTENFAKYFINDTGNKGMSMYLNQVCVKNKKIPTIFSYDLFASANYCSNYKQQKDCLNGFLKPVFTVWYHLHGNRLNAMIVTPQEAKQLAAAFKDSPTSWISTTQDHVVAGKRPAGILQDERYQTLREQVRFFNGEFAALLKQETPLVWVTEQLQDKMDFFETHLRPYRPGSAQELQTFRTIMAQTKTEGFDYIIKHPFKNLTQFDWHSIFPHIIPAQATVYKKIAEAYVYINENWGKQKLHIAELQQKFNLPLNSLVYLDNLLLLLSSLTLLWSRLYIDPPIAFLRNLSERELNNLERCLGMSIKSLYELNGLTPLKSQDYLNVKEFKAVSIMSIKVLDLLQTCPFFQNKIPFYFADYAKRKHLLTEELQALAHIKEPGEGLIESILTNPLYEDSMLTVWLQTPRDYSKELLIKFAMQFKTHDQLLLLLNQKNHTELFFQTLLNRKALTSQQLLLIYPHVKTDLLLEQLGTHPAAEQSVRTTIFKHPTLSSQVLKKLMQTRFFSLNELETVLEHPSLVSLNLLKELAEKVFDQYKANGDPKWEEHLEKIFEKAKKMGGNLLFNDLFKQRSALINSQFAFRIFAHLGAEVLPHLLCLNMVTGTGDARFFKPQTPGTDQVNIPIADEGCSIVSVIG